LDVFLFKCVVENLFEDLPSEIQEYLIGGATRVVTTGVSATPNGFLRNPSAPQDFFVTEELAAEPYPFNHGLFQTGVNGLGVLAGRGYADGSGNWRQPGQSKVTIVWGDAPPLP
jgi:hypothetical protein